ncbi:hypothetical protein T439DRAFT_378961 [Meredithblackwellia eburnea MCA 4105]
MPAASASEDDITPPSTINNTRAKTDSNKDVKLPDDVILLVLDALADLRASVRHSSNPVATSEQRALRSTLARCSLLNKKIGHHAQKKLFEGLLIVLGTGSWRNESLCQILDTVRKDDRRLARRCEWAEVFLPPTHVSGGQEVTTLILKECVNLRSVRLYYRMESGANLARDVLLKAGCRLQSLTLFPNLADSDFIPLTTLSVDTLTTLSLPVRKSEPLLFLDNLPNLRNVTFRFDKLAQHAHHFNLVYRAIARLEITHLTLVHCAPPTPSSELLVQKLIDSELMSYFPPSVTHLDLHAFRLGRSSLGGPAKLVTLFASGLGWGLAVLGYSYDSPIYENKSFSRDVEELGTDLLSRCKSRGLLVK